MTVSGKPIHTSLPWVPASCLGFFFFLLYKDAFSMLMDTWSNMPMYSHGLIIPLASLYFVWMMRFRLFTTPTDPNAAEGFFFKKTNGAIVLVSVEMREANYQPALFNRTVDFILSAKPIIYNHLPPNNTAKG